MRKGGGLIFVVYKEGGESGNKKKKGTHVGDLKNAMCLRSSPHSDEKSDTPAFGITKYTAYETRISHARAHGQNFCDTIPNMKPSSSSKDGCVIRALHVESTDSPCVTVSKGSDITIATRASIKRQQT